MLNIFFSVGVDEIINNVCIFLTSLKWSFLDTLQDFIDYFLYYKIVRLRYLFLSSILRLV